MPGAPSLTGLNTARGILTAPKKERCGCAPSTIRAFLTVKGITTGATRAEYEYEIPAADADAMLNDLCENPLVEKSRYKIDFDGFVWEVDEFFGENQGLIVAEIELESEDQKFEIPGWIGEEVTGDPKYFNSNLINNPYLKW